MDSVGEKVYQFCNIQIQVLKQREERLRKDLLDCKIQQEFLASLISDIAEEKQHDK